MRSSSRAAPPIAVSSWSDALDELGSEGVMQGITPRSGSGRMCGFAVTAKQVPGRFGDYDRSDFAVADWSPRPAREPFS